MYDMEQPHKGDIGSLFVKPDKVIKRRSLEKAIRESRTYVQISEASKLRLLNYEDGAACR